jgi:hypothetical protein
MDLVGRRVKEPDNIDLRRVRAMAEDDRVAYGDGCRWQS